MSGPEPVWAPTREATDAEWQASSLILAEGEAGVASDTGVTKYGNGTDVWSDLDAVGGAGVAVVRRKLGPLTITLDADGAVSSWEDYDQPGASTGATLSAGSIIEAAWIEASEGSGIDFVADHAEVAVVLVSTDDPSDIAWILTYDIASQQFGQGAVVATPIQRLEGVLTNLVPLRLLVDCDVYLGFYLADAGTLFSTDAPLTAYILYSEPA